MEELEGLMEVRHLVITCILTMNNQEIPTQMLIHSGTTHIAFMDQNFACHHQIRIQQLKQKKQVEVINGKPIKSGYISHIANVGIKTHDHKEQLPMFVTQLWQYRIVIRIP